MGAHRTQFWGTLELLAGLGTAERQKVGNSWVVDWIGSGWGGKGWELWQRSGRGWRRRGRERGGCPLRLWGGGASWRWRRCELRAPQRLAERRSRPRRDDFEAGPIGCRRWRGEALHLTHSRCLLRTARHPVLLIGGRALGCSAPIAEEGGVELVGLVAHDVHGLPFFLRFRTSWPRLGGLGLLLGLWRAGRRQKGVVADGWRSADVGRVLPGGRQRRCGRGLPRLGRRIRRRRD